MRLGLGLSLLSNVAAQNVGGGGDTTAPSLSSPTGTQTGQTTATIGVTTNEGNGTLYSYVSTSATPPSTANLKDGTGAVFANSQTVESTGAKSASATGLTASTAYYVHWLHRDAAGNESTIATSSSFTTASSGGGAFAPTDGTNLDLWFKANDASTLTIETGVAEFRDKSGNSRHVSCAVAANQPTVAAASQNGKDTLLYDTNDFLNGADYPTTGFVHIFACAKNTAVTGGRHIFRKGYANTTVALRFATATTAQFYVRNQANSQSSVLTVTVPTDYCVLEAWWDGTTMSFSCDGGTPVTQSFAGTSLNDSTEGFGVGCTGYTSPEPLGSNFAELFVHSTKQGDSYATAAKTYLKSEWGTA